MPTAALQLRLGMAEVRAEIKKYELLLTVLVRHFSITAPCQTPVGMASRPLTATSPFTTQPSSAQALLRELKTRSSDVVSSRRIESA